MKKSRSIEESVLFVCLGNICRSPTAEGVFRERAARAGMEKGIVIASAGIGDWHVGEPPDRRAIAHAARRGYDIARLRARQVSSRDFEQFRWILAMDQANLDELESMRPSDHTGHVGLLLDLAPSLGVREVPDPYYGGDEGFERALDLIESACDSLLERIGSGKA